MGRAIIRPRRPEPRPRRCEECAHAYGLHEANVKGEMFMYHCAKREPFSVIKTWPACGEFKERKDEDRG